MYDIIIKNGQLYDGTGAPAYTADIAIADGIIVKIGKLDTMQAETMIDAAGKRVCPGFIDMHSHADLSIVQYPDAESLLEQGITTVFTGHCGMGMAPVGEYWKTQGDDIFALEDFQPLSSIGSIPGRTPVCRSDQMRKAYKKYFGVEMDWTSFGDYCCKLREQGVGVNMAMEVGLQQIRQQVLGLDSDRPATEKETSQMADLVREAMDSGAFGMTIGYDYTPDLSASHEELDRLVSVVKEYGGIVAAHTRNGMDGNPEWQPIDGIREFLDMGLRTGARMHCSHVQPGFRITPSDRKLVEQSAMRTIEIINEYREKGVSVSWDVLHPRAAAFYYYPELCSPLLHYILACGGKKAFQEKLNDEAYFNWLLEKIRKRVHILFPRLEDAVSVTRCQNQAYVGKTLRELAKEADICFEEMVLRILKEDIDACIRPVLACERVRDADGVIDTFHRFWTHDGATLGTDNCAFNYDYEGHLPDLPSYRSTTTAYSGFVTFLLESEKESIPFEKTIRKLTGNAANILGLHNRGYLKEGQKADIVVLDMEYLATNENEVDPRQQPSGLDYVVVNGKIAVAKGVHSHIRSGEVLDFRSLRRSSEN